MKRTQKTQLQIEHVAPHTLLPHPRNPRTISSAQMAALERSITQFGMVDPVVVRKADRTVIGGHQRLEAARTLGLKTMPAVFLDLSQEQASLLNIALNKIAGDWDLERLGEILSELRDLPDVDVTLTGFDSQELEELFAGMEAEGDFPGDCEHLDADLLSRLAHPKATGRVQPGQLWVLGRHRLLCADSLEPGVLHRLCLGRKVPITVTDPPYGIDFTSQSQGKKAAIANDSAEGFASFLERALPAVKSVMSSGATLCGCYAAMEPALQAQVEQSMAAADRPPRSRRAASASMPMWDRCLACLGWSRRCRANPDGRETLISAVPSPRNKGRWCDTRDALRGTQLAEARPLGEAVGGPDPAAALPRAADHRLSAGCLNGVDDQGTAQIAVSQGLDTRNSAHDTAESPSGQGYCGFTAN